MTSEDDGLYYTRLFFNARASLVKMAGFNV